MIDAAERVAGDPRRAWDMLRAMLELRMARGKEWGPEVEGDRAVARGRPSNSPGGAMPSHPAPSIKPRRPFLGYDREIEAYEQLKPQLLDRAEGRYVVLVGDEMIGPFPGHSEAERAGYAKFGLGPLFIKRVLAEEPVIEVTRFVAP